ncbi:hypothetical protein MTBUT4_110065 [Magnetospirillum sp. UT-4]|nr:hypothetical protein MTBUT4_110065 [Magnetospirillum sp. UT-4]
MQFNVHSASQSFQQRYVQMLGSQGLPKILVVVSKPRIVQFIAFLAIAGQFPDFRTRPGNHDADTDFVRIFLDGEAYGRLDGASPPSLAATSFGRSSRERFSSLQSMIVRGMPC